MCHFHRAPLFQQEAGNVLNIASGAGDEHAADRQRHGGTAHVVCANAPPLSTQGREVARGGCALVQKVDVDNGSHGPVEAGIGSDEPLWG